MIIKDFIKAEFGLKDFNIKKLAGYDNVNYHIQSSEKSYVFKTYSHSEELEDLTKAENEALLNLQKKPSTQYPAPVAFGDGLFVKTAELQGGKKICRMLTFLEGKFMGDIEPTPQLMESLGSFLAETDLKLGKLKDYRLRSRTWEWDIQHLHLNKKYLADIPDPRNRNLALYFFQQYEENVLPLLPQFRKQIIHNDANEWNVLTKAGRVSGIIDFGDITHSYLINELAVALAYVCYDKEEPLVWANLVLSAYHKILPLEEKEIAVLYYLIAARLVISVCNSAHARKTDPDNSYTSVSEKNAWAMLKKWLEINPLYAENEFRAAVELPRLEAPAVESIVEKRHQFLSPVLSLSYREPIYMKKAAFQYMYDAYGNTFLDAYNNIPHVGHSHPKVVAAGQKQMAVLNTNTRYLYDQLAGYAEKLLAKFPQSLNRVYFVNSGSAAADLAIRMAKFHTGFEKIMVMESGYHGNSQTGIDISDYKFNNPKGQGQKNYILKTAVPDSYRGKYAEAGPETGEKYAEDTIQELQAQQGKIAAFICEPILGCAGQVPLAPGYLKAVYPAVRHQGGVCISDEVQTGFGRVGTHFWGYELQGVVPDIVVLGKPMANGHPMGAVVCTQAIAESFEKGVEFFSSFGGNPVSCAIASAVLDVIAEEKLQKNALTTGKYYKSLFKNLQVEHPCIGDVRGAGLFLGVDIVKAGTKTPDTRLAHHIKNELRKQYILVSTDGPYDNVIKTKPPISFTKEQAEKVIGAFEQILKISK